MPIQQIPQGVPTTLLQNEVAALPANNCFVFSSAAIDASVDGTTWGALTGANTTGIQTGARFVRCPLSGAIVSAKRT